jgi:ribosomal protein S18 acetylase RimI-like enzyme
LVTVVGAFAAGRGGDAAALVFEYMAATQAETGHPVPAGMAELPAILQCECQNLPAVYCLPGALLIADIDGQPVGCVGIAPSAAKRTGEVKRLYVRPARRRRGIATLLMSHAHQHAAQHGMTRLVLDVLPARTAVIGFYRRLGYRETEPDNTESPVPMIYLARSITTEDIAPGRVPG